MKDEPAFPLQRLINQTPEIHQQQFGLTKREYFSVELLGSILSNTLYGFSRYKDRQLEQVKLSMEYADALIEELEKDDN